MYNKEVLEWVNQFKYYEAQKAQALVDLHVLKHKIVSVKYIIDLLDTLVNPIPERLGSI